MICRNIIHFQRLLGRELKLKVKLGCLSFLNKWKVFSKLCQQNINKMKSKLLPYASRNHINFRNKIIKNKFWKILEVFKCMNKIG